jgi:ribosomal protein L37E
MASHTPNWNKIKSIFKKRCKKEGRPFEVINQKQCPHCGYDPIKDWKVAKKLKSTPSNS